MVLLHGGSPKGAELIAAKWATNRKVPQIAFKPEWTKHAKAAPFKRNDAMLAVLPIGVMHFPGTGADHSDVSLLGAVVQPRDTDYGVRREGNRQIVLAFDANRIRLPEDLTNLSGSGSN